MNLSCPFAQRAPTPTRYVGIGLVVALHLAGIHALSAGLVWPPARPQESTVLLPPIPDQQPEREPVRELVKAEKPTLITVPTPEVPAPPTWTEYTSTAVTESPRGEPVTPTNGPVGAMPAAAVSTAKPADAISAPGAVCSVMPRPEVPAMSWSGNAVLQVLATVRGGRVIGSEVRFAQGTMDGKTRRSLQRSVEAALSGYQCQDDATFQQDFAFHVD